VATAVSPSNRPHLRPRGRLLSPGADVGLRSCNNMQHATCRRTCGVAPHVIPTPTPTEPGRSFRSRHLRQFPSLRHGMLMLDDNMLWAGVELAEVHPLYLYVMNVRPLSCRRHLLPHPTMLPPPFPLTHAQSPLARSSSCCALGRLAKCHRHNQTF
jgi:hypothetical protein